MTGRALVRAGHALVAGDERWPIIDEIPFLRADRRELADAALAALDRGDRPAALVLLLADRDDWAAGPPPDATSLRTLVRDVGQLTYRAAMALLRFGPVADYLAHRWSDPTFFSGLALAEAHWGDARRVFELACGPGPFLRAFAPHAAVSGGDVVFSKLWLGRHFVVPDAPLICFDAAAPWPLPDDAADTVFCHDAFYFLPAKPHVAREMRRVAPRVLIGHTHNADGANFSSGAPLSVAAYASLLDAEFCYDDAALTRAWADAAVPLPDEAVALRAVAAVSFASGAGPPGPVTGRFGPTGVLRRNPLYGASGRIDWPSDRYRDEYAALATYPDNAGTMPETLHAASSDRRVRCGTFVDLPARW